MLQSAYDLAKSTDKVQQLELSNQRTQFKRNIIMAVAISVFVLLLVVLFYYKGPGNSMPN